MQCLQSMILGLNHSQRCVRLNKLHHNNVQRVTNAGIWIFKMTVHTARWKHIGKRGVPAGVLSYTQGARGIAYRCAPREQPPVPDWEAGAAGGLLGVRHLEGIPYRSPAAAGAWVCVPGAWALTRPLRPLWDGGGRSWAAAAPGTSCGGGGSKGQAAAAPRR